MSAEEDKKEILAPMMESGVHAGFPSPAQDYINSFIDLNKELVRHPAATFFARVVGDSMVDADVNEGDVLVVDKSIEPKEGDMAVCFIDGEFALKFIFSITNIFHPRFLITRVPDFAAPQFTLQTTSKYNHLFR